MIRIVFSLTFIIFSCGLLLHAETTQEEEEMKKMQLRICVSPDGGSEDTKPKSLLGPANPAGPCKPGVPAVPTALPYQPNEFFIARKQDEAKHLRLLFHTGFTSITGLTSTTLNGAGLGATTLYSFMDKAAFGFTLTQAFSANMTAMFTRLDIELRWAITGALSKRNSKISVYDQPVIETDTVDSGGLRAQVFMHQYFVNAGIATLPFPGAGVGLTYDFSTTDRFNYYVGLRLDRATNDKQTVYPLQAVAGVGLWL